MYQVLVFKQKLGLFCLFLLQKIHWWWPNSRVFSELQRLWQIQPSALSYTASLVEC